LPKKESLKQAKIRNTYSFVNRSSGEKRVKGQKNPKKRMRMLWEGEREKKERAGHTLTHLKRF